MKANFLTKVWPNVAIQKKPKETKEIEVYKKFKQKREVRVAGRRCLFLNLITNSFFLIISRIFEAFEWIEFPAENFRSALFKPLNAILPVSLVQYISYTKTGSFSEIYKV